MVLTEPPRTRAEEIMLARGFTQKETSELGGWHTSNLSRIMSGKMELSAINRRALAGLFQATEGDFLEPIGSPIRPPGQLPAVDFTSTVPGFDRRLAALLLALSINRTEDILMYLLSGDFSRLPPRLRRRLREILQNHIDSGMDGTKANGSLLAHFAQQAANPRG